MTAAERGVLLLCAQLSDGEKPLTMAQFRTLSKRAHALGMGEADPLRELCEKDLLRLGYSVPDAEHIVRLLSREAELSAYLAAAERLGIFPLTRISLAYPKRLAAQLGILDVIKNETVTCYNGVPGAGCGTCPSCLLRNRGLKAFERRRAE